jgi:hypothetical protein
MSITNNDLVKLAFSAMQNSYSPYSHCKVGSALLSKNGKVYLGCNVENASYGVTNCAERTAFFNAVSEITCKIIITGSPIINLYFLVLCRIVSIVINIATLPPEALIKINMASGILALRMYFDANLSYNVTKTATADIIKK